MKKIAMWIAIFACLVAGIGLGVYAIMVSRPVDVADFFDRSLPMLGLALVLLWTVTCLLNVRVDSPRK
jgi:hypothetical protein